MKSCCGIKRKANSGSPGCRQRSQRSIIHRLTQQHPLSRHHLLSSHLSSRRRSRQRLRHIQTRSSPRGGTMQQRDVSPKSSSSSTVRVLASRPIYPLRCAVPCSAASSCSALRPFTHRVSRRSCSEAGQLRSPRPAEPCLHGALLLGDTTGLAQRHRVHWSAGQARSVSARQSLARPEEQARGRGGSRGK